MKKYYWLCITECVRDSKGRFQKPRIYFNGGYRRSEAIRRAMDVMRLKGVTAEIYPLPTLNARIAKDCIIELIALHGCLKELKEKTQCRNWRVSHDPS